MFYFGGLAIVTAEIASNKSWLGCVWISDTCSQLLLFVCVSWTAQYDLVYTRVPVLLTGSCTVMVVLCSSQCKVIYPSRFCTAFWVKQCGLETAPGQELHPLSSFARTEPVRIKWSVTFFFYKLFSSTHLQNPFKCSLSSIHSMATKGKLWEHWEPGPPWDPQISEGSFPWVDGWMDGVMLGNTDCQ